ncbi:hypothetical protein [Fimbriiglobus ruber]|uniref:DUF5666 domain-containing protein n=1 Tax=Fimbriiglobus ruber TaxID=1908690 RepID=A0A225E2G9_9BACT|nr:hypothetical protein [Fimbriiglobus ruber]OWK47433.1 hypothetical protein FRUB_01132 [Fimbriiglobus ruber]
MKLSQSFLTSLKVAVLFAAMGGFATAADKDPKKEVGIFIDKKDDWITVKADGEDEPVKYVVDRTEKKLQEAFKTVFNASRVQVTYTTNGDTRKLTGIKRQVLKATGTITGDVVKVHNDFWVEVKPKTGVADAFAPGENYKDQNFMAKLKGLQEGDSVTITYYTDFERHRIKTMKVNPPKK